MTGCTGVCKNVAVSYANVMHWAPTSINLYCEQLRSCSVQAFRNYPNAHEPVSVHKMHAIGRYHNLKERTIFLIYQCGSS